MLFPPLEENGPRDLLQLRRKAAMGKDQPWQ
jgi:hypothetical protein